jgi:signal transduction histidine kinase
MSNARVQNVPGFAGMLDSLVRLIEHQSPAMRCSILLLDTDHETLRHGAGPSLPVAYCNAIDGLRIGPDRGSCGTAAYTRQTTIVSDIATDERWAEYRHLALPHGLRACWSTPILSADGECLGTFAMYYDEPRAPSHEAIDLITTAALLAGALIERERLLTTSEAHRAALAEANATLEAQAEELDAANRAKSDFLATMSHELRTPLNAIAGYADLLLAGVRGELTPPQRSDIERMKRSGQHLLGLINDILNFAKLEAGQVEFHISQVRVAPLLQSLEELVRPQVDAKSLSYEQGLAVDDLAIHGDAEKIRQVLLNLVTNAVKFTDAGGRISVDCDADESRVFIRVRDTGRGIPEQHLAHIFDPFIQIDRERTPRSQQGVGLGLSISRDLARGMGGSLSAVSAVGEGSTFTLSLPRGTRPTRADTAAQVSENPAALTT